jgi:hypothetical protein
MCYQNSVLDRALMSDEGGGLDAPDTDLEAIEEHIGRLPDSDLKQTVIAAQQLIDRTHAEIAFLVRELDRRHLPELDEGLSTVGWLKRHTPMTASQASGTVKTARVLGHMPTVMEAALEGAVPHRSLQLLAQARNRHKIEFVDHRSVFGETPETMRRITCDAGIIPMVLGTDSEPLDVGRKTRTIPAALRRALEQRDKGCTWGRDAGHPCHGVTHTTSSTGPTGTPSAFLGSCSATPGTETNLTNCQLLCRTHHTATHNSERSPPEP